MQSKLYNIPAEMRLYKQFCVWRYEDTENPKPTKVPYSARTNGLCSVTDPNTWSTFDEAISAVTNTDWYDGIGFVLSESDPYSFIDLDDNEGDQAILDRQMQIYQTFTGYAERSPSGKGLHIIVRGSIPNGRRRSKIEVYSSERYMTITGEVYRDAPILDHNDALNALWLQMGEGRNATLFYAGLEKAKLTDEKVLEIAAGAQNKEKFHDLFKEGNWQKYYPSQSEADFALIDILAYYSENAHQVQRLFLQSKLGQREKSRAQYRINYMLNRCFDRMLPPIDIDGLQNQIADAIANGKKEKKAEPKKRIAVEATPFTVPPGLLGKLAEFIYAAAPRPVPEIALAGAIGLMSGIVGRAYNVSKTGLNQYVLLLAGTGTGKEGIAAGIDRVMRQVVKTVPSALDFLGPAEISSQQALAKYLMKYPSFVSVVGEFGLAMRQMTGPSAPPHLIGLRKLMLDLYNKSGEGNQLRPTIYSDKDKNTSTITAPAFTMLGESTPERFYELLNEGMIEEGFLPRFTIIEYRGPRPKLNKAHQTIQPSFELVDNLSSLCAYALQLNSQHKAIHVVIDEASTAIFEQFDDHCDANINSADREIRKQLWNRAHVKAMKLAALVAIGCDAYNPKIIAEFANWAIEIVVSDVRNLLGRFDAGEIGIDNDETRQLNRAIAAVKEYILRPWSEIKGYGGNSDLHAEKIIPYAFLHKKMVSAGEFKKDKLGATNAVKRTIKTLIERGDLQEVPRATMAAYNTHANCYMVSNAKVFGIG